MVVVVLAVQVVDVGGADQGAAELARDLDDPLVRLVLLGDPVALELEVDLLGAEDVDQVVDVRTGVVGAVLDDPAAEARLQAAGQGDHALGVAREQLHVQVRLAAREALEEPGRAEADQVAEPRVVVGHQGQVVALVARHPLDGLAVVHQVGLDAEDRLDPDVLAGLVVLDRAVHDAVVGQPEGGHVELGRALGERLAADRLPLLVLLPGAELAGAVEQRVLAVDVQMCDPGCAHLAIMPITPDATGVSQNASLRYLPDSVIWLLRHGEAEDEAPGAGGDAERRLTGEGREAVAGRRAGAEGARARARGVPRLAQGPRPRHRRARLRVARPRGRARRPPAPAAASTPTTSRPAAATSCWSATSPTSRTRSPRSPAPGRS